MKDLDIAEVARRSGVPASALRYYEERGLIQSSGRNGIRRLFDPSVLDRLGLIAMGRVAGFALDEIAAIFAPDGPRIPRDRLHARADEIDRKVAELQALSTLLRHTADCPEADQLECKTFRKLMRVANSMRGKMPDTGVRRR